MYLYYSVRHFNFFWEMSLDIALTLVRGPGWLSALAPLLVPLLLFFRPATNRDRSATNRDLASDTISICSKQDDFDLQQGGLNLQQVTLSAALGGHFRKKLSGQTH